VSDAIIILQTFLLDVHTVTDARHERYGQVVDVFERRKICEDPFRRGHCLNYSVTVSPLLIWSVRLVFVALDGSEHLKTTPLHQSLALYNRHNIYRQHIHVEG
jgi:hypothetical protein